MSFINKALSGIFGSKTAKDLKELSPYVGKINSFYDQYQQLSHNELRAKTDEFKKRILDYLQEIETELKTLDDRIENESEMDMQEKEEIFRQIDKLKKDRNTKIEEILLELLPEAFAVVKETAHRFKELKSIEVTATDHDKNIAAHKTNVKISGDSAVWENKWLAAGGEITWDMLHYDVQLIGGVALHQGKIAEMGTGEGKTLVGTLPIYLNALAGKGVHIVTVNDYLARRDSEWNGPIFEFLGLTVDCIDKHQPNSPERRKAYAADITYGTNNEFGFDYLRDNMARDGAELVQRGHHYAIVDEVDSVLIDDARTPLIISGPTPKGDRHEFHELKPRIEKLVNTQRNYTNTQIADARKLIEQKKEDEAGMALLRAHRGLPKNKALIKLLGEQGVRALMQKTENYHLQDNQREMHKVDAELYFVIDEKNNTIELTEKGIDLITQSGEDHSFFILPDVGSVTAELEKSSLTTEEKLQKKDELMRDFSIKSERIQTINQLLKAYTLFENDVEYIITDGKIKIVDEQTGRVLEGRRYSDGLHQAIEAKENVKVEDATQTYATITLQNYFRMFHKLAGMTGTAETEAGELWQIYKLDVVVIPTNKPVIRKDEEDFVYKTKREKYNKVIDEIERLSKAGRPSLVGTTSVEISELLSRMLKLRGIKHNVLNAKQHQREAEIVAEAGQAGTVTIATNMAGRGNHRSFSGVGVREAGGLAIIGTERHESRRVDRQLRGRAGRQGDPGSSQFFVSLEDDLMRMFGSGRIAKLMDRMGIEEGEVIQHSMITKSIERAQKKVEENNFGTRKRLLEYDDVMNSQREVIYSKRKHALFGDRLSIDINNMLFDVSESLVTEYVEQRNFEGFKLDLIRFLSIESPVEESEFLSAKPEEVSQKVFDAVSAHYKHKSQTIAAKAYPIIKQVFEEQGATIENIAVPFSDGMRGIQVSANLKKAFDTQARELITAFERGISLALIDDVWKEHLRELDDLKQSVQNAVYEQKDPLIIYKFESFDLFRQMLDRVNKDIISFLMKGAIPIQEPGQVRQAQRPQRTDNTRLTAGRDSRAPIAQGSGMPRQQQPQQEQRAPQPVRVEQKTGRNDPCPCGSGKKYKNCHGKGQV